MFQTSLKSGENFPKAQLVLISLGLLPLEIPLAIIESIDWHLKTILLVFLLDSFLALGPTLKVEENAWEKVPSRLTLSFLEFITKSVAAEPEVPPF